MKRNLGRLIWALVFSSACFLGTVFWFNSTKDEVRHEDRQPVAKVNEATNEVQRKPKQRVIWESVTRNEELYPGEAIRTAPNADAQLYFMKTKTTVHLEPDSLIVLEQNDQGLSLDFLQGNVFVQSAQNGSGGEGLTVKTGNGEIKLNKADMSLSKGQNGHVALEVTRGEAELSQGSKKTALNKDKSADLTDKGVSIANDRIDLLHPSAGETVYLNLANGEKLDLAWKPLPAGYKISVQVGATRAALDKSTTAQAAGESGELRLTTKPGRRYLRLIATSSDEKMPPMSSVVIPFEVAPKSVPILVEPEKDAAILKKAPDEPVEFSWESATTYQSQVFEVAADRMFKSVKLRKDFDGDTDDFSGILPDGAYYWRVTGFLKVKGKSESLMSPIQKFNLTSNWETKPPVLAGPANAQHVSYVDAQKAGVQLKWQAPQGVQRFRVTVQKKTDSGWTRVQEQEVETSFYHLLDVKPGLYQWQVASLDERGGEPKAAAPWEFTVEDMPKIEWTESAPTQEYIYRTPKPSLSAKWKPLAVTPAYYRFRVAKAGDLDNAEWQISKQPSLETALPEDGKYEAVVEALNSKGQMLGQSDVKIFDVKAFPLLPAPQWAESTPDVLKADGKGNLTFGWEKVEGAQNYLMILESADGKVLDQKEISRTTASLNKLKPGEYQVHLKSVDGYKRPGEDGQKRKIEVPETSDIRAPKIKAMKIK